MLRAQPRVTRAVFSRPFARRSGATAACSPGERPDDLAALVIAEAVARAGVPAGEIEDVWFGCANQAGEDNRNVARMAGLLAGLPESVAGVTVNRLCASGLSAPWSVPATRSSRATATSSSRAASSRCRARRS